MTRVTDAYLLGIREGREYLNRFKPDVQQMRDVLANVEATLRMKFGPEVGDLLRGERDFWRNQIKRARA